MAKGKVKKKEYERLDDATISRVISLLQREKPITKKEACEILNISYNTTRLNKIVEEFKSRKEYETRRKKENARKPLGDGEIKYIVSSYLQGESISSIAKGLYRSVSIISNFIKNNGFPSNEKTEYGKPALIPEENLQEDYEANELVWSARYGCVAEVKKKVRTHSTHGNVYEIWVFGNKNFFAMQPWYEMAKLNLDKFGVNANEIIPKNTSLNLTFRIE